MRLPPARLVRWKTSYRIIASRYPPIDVFERTGMDGDAAAALFALEQRTKPPLAPGQAITGPGAGFAMAPFLYTNPKGSRFTDGSFGAWYVARALETALRETVYHWGRFARDSADPPGRAEDMRVLTTPLNARLIRVGDLGEDAAPLLDPDSYVASQRFGAQVRAAGETGMQFPSVRHAGGQCACLYSPRAVTLPISQERHLKYHWDGARVDRVFDYKLDAWQIL
ncbi:MAG: RES family NAD+ phosphorylase [Pseudomonadota bacterium]